VAESESREEAVLAANEAFYHAFNEKDIDAMDSAWAASADVACVHPGWNLLFGREQVIESWRRILANPEQLRIFTGGETVVFVGDVALVLCRELVGGAPLAATNVFVQEDGAWKLLHHHSGPVSM
jgi:ketosteroid isomerase-like protein